VRFPTFDEFVRTARRDGIDVRPTLLRVVTDFYVQKPVHSAEEDEHFAALALRLIDEVDEDTRLHVARQLADYGTAPLPVLERLGLLEPPPPEPEPEPEPAPLQIGDADRAAAARFSAMFFAADSARRLAILRELDTTASAPPLAIPPDAAAAATERLERAALNGRPYEFAREIERALGVPLAHAETIINDASGEALLVLGRALDMPQSVIQRILLLVNPLIGSSVRRVFDLCALYEDISRPSALRLVSLWRNASTPPAPAGQPRHEPAQWPYDVSDPRDRTRLPAPPAYAPLRKDQRAS